MFKHRITICVMTPSGMMATVFIKTRKGVVFEKRIDQITFASLKNQYHITEVRMLLSEDDTYLKLIELPKGVVTTRDLVKEHMSMVVPEPIDDVFMDWKIVETTSENTRVQVFVVKQSVLAPMIQNARDAGIEITACEPSSLAMARLTKHINESFLLIYPPVKPEYLVAVSGGKVLEVASVDALHSLEDAKKSFILYVKKVWGVTVTAIATDVPNPMVGLATKRDFQGSDMDVLTVPSVASAKQTRSLPIPFIIGGVALLVCITAFIIIRVFGMKPAETKSEQLSVAVVSPTATPSTIPVQKASIVVEIQNGNGEAGLAGKWKDVLIEAGYTTVTTGNADNYDYTGVIIQAKTAEIAAMLMSDLESPNASATAATSFLDSMSSIDAIVIVGRNPAL